MKAGAGVPPGCRIGQADVVPQMRDTVILHVDMDAFYAAIEVLDHPEWKGLPLVVGAPPDRRGVVATCSYEARTFGIHSAMPSRTAGKLCPNAIFVPPRMDRYAAISTQIMAIFEEFTPLVEPLSLDEAFLDVSGAFPLWPDAITLARELKARIRARVGLTASVGIASNKFLAKMASDMNKPDGLTVVPVSEEGIRAFLNPLPVGKLWGVGEVSAARLEQAGIRTIGQLQALDAAALERLFGAAGAHHMAELIQGHDDRPVITDWDEKSISNEHTFDRDEPDRGKVRQRLLELAEEVGGRLRKSGKLAGTARIKIRLGDFSTLTRQMALCPPLDTDRDLIACAFTLFDRESITRAVRLIGFGVSRLAEPDLTPPVQGELFDDEALPSGPDPRNRKLDRAVDALRKTFGETAVRRGHAGRK
jgi:DNA polymerase-4